VVSCRFFINFQLTTKYLGINATYTELELVTLLKERNNQAYSYLYEHYSGALYSIILQIISEQDLASDVLQEVFVNIWRKIETYDPTRGRLFTWMLNVARNASIDLIRSKGYQNAMKNRELPDYFEVNVAGQTTQINIDHIGLKKVLADLKEEHRTLIDLAYFKGYTHEEIAEIEEIPLGTVKTRIRSALVQLRTILK
jgi:RNA polymerase sigma factor (sigma-70 family)